jgi:glycosyltransferase involved in cell wall biosynthesis
MAQQQPDWRFVMYHRGIIDHDPFASFGNVVSRPIDLPGDRWNLWEHARLPVSAVRDRVDLLHCPANSSPSFSVVPVVATIHDLIPLKVPGELSESQTRQFCRRVRRCARVARRIVAVSESTRNDLISDLGVDADSIDVMHWAADSRCTPVTEEAVLADMRARYNIVGPYVFALTALSVRKNALGLVRAFAALPGNLRGDLQFVLAGIEPVANRRHVLALAEQLGVAGKCRIVGFVPEADLAALTSAAELLAFCSLYEGFGLPVLDAFKCRTAVLASRTSAVPEVVGDAAWMCDPHCVEDIAEGMRRLLLDRELRDTLIERGSIRVREFTWARSAEQLAGAFRKAMKPARKGLEPARMSC